MMQGCRVIYYVYNQVAFPDVEASDLLLLMLGGTRIDVGMVFYGFGIYYLMMVVGLFLPPQVELSPLYRRIRHTAWLVPYALFLFLNLSDTGYYPYVLRRVNADVFTEFQGKSTLGFYKDFVTDFWPLTLAFVALMLLGVLGYFAVRLRRAHREEGRSIRRKVAEACGVVLVLILGARGTVRSEIRPMSVDLVKPFVHHYMHMPIALNAPYTLTHRLTARREYDFFSADELVKHFTPCYRAEPLTEKDSLYGCMAGRNIVVLIMESMAKEYSGYLNREIPGYSEGYTPFLDSIIPHSLYAKYGFATGKRSVESFPSIFVSMPSFGGSFNDEDWKMDNYPHLMSFDTGIPLSLGGRGYDLKFYHGDEKGAMGFFPFLQKLGVEQQYTAEEYREEHPDAGPDVSCNWGIHDRDFLEAAVTDMRQLKEPFGAFFFTLSNHHPFVLPEKCAGRYPEGTLPIHRTAAYADDAIRLFFEKAKNEPWYPNTLFVLTADHTNLSDRPEYQNTAGRAAVPILLYDPRGQLTGELSDYVVQHADIYPTLLYLLGMDDRVLSYGHNMLDPMAEHYALNFYYDRYILLSRDATVLMSPAGDVQVEAPSPFLQTESGQDLFPGDSVCRARTDRLKAIVQDYNARVLSSSFSIRDVRCKETLE